MLAGATLGRPVETSLEGKLLFPGEGLVAAEVQEMLGCRSVGVKGVLRRLQIEEEAWGKILSFLTRRWEDEEEEDGESDDESDFESLRCNASSGRSSLSSSASPPCGDRSRNSPPGSIHPAFGLPIPSSSTPSNRTSKAPEPLPSPRTPAFQNRQTAAQRILPM